MSTSTRNLLQRLDAVEDCSRCEERVRQENRNPRKGLCN